MTLRSKTTLSNARRCIKIEAAALNATAQNLNGDFTAVADTLFQAAARGSKLIFSGVGKSAHICQKLTGTFNSTGITTCFLDPTQAFHGDLGLCSDGDLIILLSNSGQTEEVLRLIPLLKRFNLTTVAFTSNPSSDLAKNTALRLIYTVPQEACPLHLAPTASTTAAMALGDALAMVLLSARKLTREQFATYHPGGNLGRILLLRVSDIMRTGDRLPSAPQTITVKDAILTMTRAKSGAIALTHPKNKKLTGIFTDGDFRRATLKTPHLLHHPVAEYMTQTPKTIPADALCIDALHIFEKHNIKDLIALDKQHRPVGLIDIQDLPKLKIF